MFAALFVSLAGAAGPSGVATAPSSSTGSAGDDRTVEPASTVPAVSRPSHSPRSGQLGGQRSLTRVGTSSLAASRRASPGYGQLLGVGVDVSFLGLGPKLVVAPTQDVDVYGMFRTLGIVNTVSVGADYYPLAVVSSWRVQPLIGSGYHWLQVTRDTDGVSGILPAGLNAALSIADVEGVRAGFVSFETGVAVRLCNGFSAQVYVEQHVQAPVQSSPDDGQSFSFDHVRFPNLGVEVGGYFRPFARRWFDDRTCGRRSTPR